MKKIDPHKIETTHHNRDHTQEIRKLEFCKSGNVWIPVADNMGSGVAAQHQPLILGETWLGFPSAFLSRGSCLNISSPLLLGDQVLGPSTSWNHPFPQENTWFPQNLGPKLDHKRTKTLEISNQVVLGQERDFEVPISLGNHPFALANTQFPKNWGPKAGCPRNMGNWNIQPSYPKEKGIWKFQPRCPNKGLRCLKQTWFIPGDKGFQCLGRHGWDSEGE